MWKVKKKSMSKFSLFVDLYYVIFWSELFKSTRRNMQWPIKCLSIMFWHKFWAYFFNIALFLILFILAQLWSEKSFGKKDKMYILR